MVHAAAVFALLSLPASAGPAIPFEASLAELRSSVLAARAQIKSDGLARELSDLAAEANRLDWQAERLRRAVQDLRWRAQRSSPGRPGQPPSDPFLRSDIDRLTWDLRDLQFDSQRARDRASRAEQAAAKDPALVEPAKRFSGEAQRFASTAQWLSSDARWTAMDLRRIGYSMEAWDLERLSGDASRAADDLRGSSARILSKVQ